MNFEKLKELRKNAELTVREFADIIDMSKSQYSRWETGEQTIPLIHLNSVCNYYNVSMDYILGLTIKKSVVVKNNMLDSILVGSRIREVRDNKNLIQEDLAKFLNTSQSTISQYEDGKTVILTSFIYQIAKKYKVSADWLCGRV